MSGSRRPITMPNGSARAPNGGARIPVFPALLLSRWQLDLTWRLLVVVWVGLILSVAIMSAASLFALLAATAGLRDSLNADPINRDMTISATAVGLTTSTYSAVDQHYQGFVHQRIGELLPSQPIRSIELDDLPIGGTPNVVNLLASDLDGFAPHVTLTPSAAPPSDPTVCRTDQVNGRLPSDASDESEVALLPDAATALHEGIGDRVAAQLIIGGFFDVAIDVPLRVVGIYCPRTDGSTFWHHYSVTTTLSIDGSVYTALTSRGTLLKLLDQWHARDFPLGGVLTTTQVRWLYTLDPSGITADHLQSTRDKFDLLTGRLSEDYSPRSISSLTIESRLIDPNGLLSANADRIGTAQSVIDMVLLGAAALALFFVALLAELLVERQSEVIAQLRGRGFSRRQVFVGLAIQALALIVLSLVGGFLLALPLARVLGDWQLSSSDHTVLALLDGNLGNLWRLITLIWVPPVAVAGCAALTVFVTIGRALRRDILALRQEAGRPAEVPLWQRWRLDVFAAFLAAGGAALAVFLQSQATVLDAKTQRLLSPLLAIWPVFLLATLLLALLRIFPRLLGGATWIALRTRSAALVLALTHVARTPRQALRMTLLLALAMTFVAFLAVFNASQDERLQDAAAYQTGADFSGTIPSDVASTKDKPTDPVGRFAYEIARRDHAIPGAVSATVGFTSEEYPANGRVGSSFTLVAVDADTYAATAVWPAHQSIDAQMAQLAAARPDLRNLTADSLPPIPAIVDETTWNAFRLDDQPTFRLVPAEAPSVGPLTFVAVGRVPAIPRTAFDHGGVLVDYWTLATIVTHMTGKVANVLPNTVWVRSHMDATSVQQVRHALASGDMRLEHLQDRLGLIDTLEHAPVDVAIAGVTRIGLGIPLLLGIAGVLVASWLQMRQRSSRFAVMRALGATPRQITAILLGEQVLVYMMATLLGLAFGALISFTLVPNLLFTLLPYSVSGQDSSASSFFLSQSVPPAQVVVPPAAFWVLGGLVVVNLCALAVMTWRLRRLQVAQALRFGED